MKKQKSLGSVDVVVTGGPYQIRDISELSQKTQRRIKAAIKKYFGNKWKPKSV